MRKIILKLCNDCQGGDLGSVAAEPQAGGRIQARLKLGGDNVADSGEQRLTSLRRTDQADVANSGLTELTQMGEINIEIMTANDHRVEMTFREQLGQ